MKRVVILGGGISGLTAAYRKTQEVQKGAKLEVKLIEASSTLGGVIQTVLENGFLLERGPDCFLSQKTAGVELCRELGLEHELIETKTEYRKSYILRSQRLVPVPEGLYLMAPGAVWPFLRSPLLSWKGKLRVAVEPWISARSASDDEALASFVRRRLGKEALERIAQPMIAGIYTGDPERLSLSSTMPQFLEMEREHGSVIRALRKKRKLASSNAESSASGPRYSMFLTLKSGMQQLTDRLAAAIPSSAAIKNSPVTAIERQANTWTVRTRSESHTADELWIATSAKQAGQLLNTAAPDIAKPLLEQKLSSVVTINYTFKKNQIRKPFHGIGFVIPDVEKRDLLACTFSHHKFDGRAPEGFALLRAFAGGVLRPELCNLDDAEITRRLLKDLREILQIEGEPTQTLISRYPNSMPQYEVGHEARMKEIDARVQSLPGLHLIGNSYHGVGIPDCISSAS